MPDNNKNNQLATISDPGALLAAKKGGFVRDYQPNKVKVTIDGEKYTLGKILGLGSQGTVFAVKDNPGKVIKVSIVDNSGATLAGLNSEVRQNQQAGHFVREGVYDVTGEYEDVFPNIHFMVQDNLGTSLENDFKKKSEKELAEQPKEVNPEKRKALYDTAIGICIATDKLHSERGMAHLDHKLANVMKGDNGQYALIDFSSSTQKLDAQYVRAGTAHGTPAYLPSSDATLTNQQVDVVGLMRGLYLDNNFSGPSGKYQREELTDGFVFQDLVNSENSCDRQMRELLSTYSFEGDQIVSEKGQGRDCPAAIDLAVSLVFLKNNVSLENVTDEQRQAAKNLIRSGEDVNLLFYNGHSGRKRYLENNLLAWSNNYIAERGISNAVKASRVNADLPPHRFPNFELHRYKFPEIYHANRYNEAIKESVGETHTKQSVLQTIRILSHPQGTFTYRSKRNLPESYQKIRDGLERTAKLLGATDDEISRTLFGKPHELPDGIITYKTLSKTDKENLTAKSLQSMHDKIEKPFMSRHFGDNKVAPEDSSLIAAEVSSVTPLAKASVPVGDENNLEPRESDVSVVSNNSVHSPIATPLVQGEVVESSRGHVIQSPDAQDKDPKSHPEAKNSDNIADRNYDGPTVRI